MTTRLDLLSLRLPVAKPDSNTITLNRDTAFAAWLCRVAVLAAVVNRHVLLI
jgi:hypothetical protein